MDAKGAVPLPCGTVCWRCSSVVCLRRRVCFDSAQICALRVQLRVRFVVLSQDGQAEWLGVSRCGSRRLGQRRPDHKPGRSLGCESELLTTRAEAAADNMRSAANDAIAGRSSTEDGAAPDPAIAGCSAARWGWGSNGSGCLGIGHQNDLHTPTLCCPSGARGAVEETDWAEPLRAASVSASAASAVPAIVAPSPSGCVRFTRISCGGCHTLAIDGQMQARSDG